MECLILYLVSNTIPHGILSSFALHMSTKTVLPFWFLDDKFWIALVQHRRVDGGACCCIHDKL